MDDAGQAYEKWAEAWCAGAARARERWLEKQEPSAWDPWRMAQRAMEARFTRALMRDPSQMEFVRQTPTFSGIVLN